MPKRGTLEWYREAEKMNEALRSDLLAHTKKLQNESSRDWLYRVTATYHRQRIKEVP